MSFIHIFWLSYGEADRKEADHKKTSYFNIYSRDASPPNRVNFILHP